VSISHCRLSYLMYTAYGYRMSLCCYKQSLMAKLLARFYWCAYDFIHCLTFQSEYLNCYMLRIFHCYQTATNFWVFGFFVFKYEGGFQDFCPFVLITVVLQRTVMFSGAIQRLLVYYIMSPVNNLNTCGNASTYISAWWQHCFTF